MPAFPLAQSFSPLDGLLGFPSNFTSRPFFTFPTIRHLQKHISHTEVTVFTLSVPTLSGGPFLKVLSVVMSRNGVAASRDEYFKKSRLAIFLPIIYPHPPRSL